MDFRLVQESSSLEVAAVDFRALAARLDDRLVQNRGQVVLRFMSSGELVAGHEPTELTGRADLGQLFHDGWDVSPCFLEVMLRFRV